MALDIRQEKFVKEYVLGKSAAEAARLAGYEPSYARKAATHLLGNHEVSLAIGEARARIRNETLIEAKDLFDKLETALTLATAGVLVTALITAPDARDPALIKKLDAVAGRVLGNKI